MFFVHTLANIVTPPTSIPQLSHTEPCPDNYGAFLKDDSLFHLLYEMKITLGENMIIALLYMYV
jgi:hypothetical protein